MENKNINAINKIIAELSMQDYKSRCEKLTKTQINNIKQGKKTLSDYGGYTLREETKEAIQVKNDYLSGKITEQEAINVLNCIFRNINKGGF